MGKKTILIVPPRGVSVKAFRIRLSVAVIFFSIVILGFAGYFIPFDIFTLNEAEQNQHKNLTEQNKALLQKILSTLRLLNNLKEQVTRLEGKREVVLNYGIIDSESLSEEKKVIDLVGLEGDVLLRYAKNQEYRLKQFLSGIGENNNVFDSIPVIYPVPKPYVVSRTFGLSKDPFTSKEKWHYGVDFVAEKETPVYATASGVVKRFENHPIWGMRLYLDHANDFSTVYAHLGSCKVRYKGKKVTRGEIIGTVGISGLSTGPHLHYEVWHNGTAKNPEDYFFPETEFAEIFKGEAQ
ncbi:MAG: M23 family metallopeptidase [Fibrobacter sp.]|nr:M23 family metallopeptidase [Fibrobacter sp.]